MAMAAMDRAIPTPSRSPSRSRSRSRSPSPVLGDDLPLPPHRLFERLAQIPGHTWDQSAEIIHSSYDHWHVAGLRCADADPLMLPTPVSSARSKDSGFLSHHTSPKAEPRGFLRHGYGASHNQGHNLSRTTPSESSSSEVSSARNESMPVVARISTHTIRLEREYTMLRSIVETSDPECEHTVRPIDLLRLSPQPGENAPILATLYEDPGFNHLRKLVSFGPAFFQADGNHDRIEQAPVEKNFEVSTFLDFAIGACECLELLHYGLKTIHGEIRPDAFHYNYQTGAVKLSNTGNGARAFDNVLSDGWSILSRELGAKHKLQYIAPEQTGRLPTEPDTRTDIYALGVLFWAMLVGRPAFEGDDPVEVVQNVLSKKLSPVSSRRLDIPAACSAVIQKMTQKTIDDRYHTISAVKWDLQQIVKLLGDGEKKALDEFTIAQRDISSFFTLPTGLFGRKDELDKILAVIRNLQKRQHSPKAQALAHASSRPSHNSLSLYASSGSSVSGERLDNGEAGDAASDSGSMAMRHTSLTGSAPLVRTSTLDSAHSGESAPSTNKTISIAHAPAHRMKSPADSRLSRDIADRDGHLSSVSGSYNQFDGMAAMGRRKVQARYRDGGRCQVIAISGTGGLGKSDLIQRVQPVIRKQGYIGVARLDQSRRVPFEPFKKLLASLMRQMFSEGDVTTEFHSSIRTILKPVWASLHVELNLPEQLLYSLASSSGQSACKPRKSAPLQAAPLHAVREDVPDHNAADNDYECLAQKSSKTFWRDPTSAAVLQFGEIFIGVLKIMSFHKLTCLCLEDIQYADSETSQLLIHIMRAKVPCLVMVTSRLDEVTSPDVRAIFHSSAPNVLTLELQPLSEDDILEYIAATMQQKSSKALIPLTAVILEKSQGIPFYVRMMLETCYRKTCIWYCWKDSLWQYDLDRIFKEFVVQNYGEGLGIEFIARRFQEMPSEARSILLWAALLGSPFSFSLVRKLLSGEFLYTIGGEDEEDITCPRRTRLRQSATDIVGGLQYLIQSYVIIPGDTDDEFR